MHSFTFLEDGHLRQCGFSITNEGRLMVDALYTLLRHFVTFEGRYWANLNDNLKKGTPKNKEQRDRFSKQTGGAKRSMASCFSRLYKIGVILVRLNSKTKKHIIDVIAFKFQLILQAVKLSWLGLICEELVTKRLLNSHAVGRVDDESAFEEVFAIGAEAFEGQQGWMVLRVQRTVVLHLGDLWVVFLVWCSHQLEDAVDHRELAVAPEQRLAQDHLSHYATRCPHIHSFSVLQRPQQDLRSPVPKRRDVRRVLLLPKQRQLRLPEVTQLQHILPIDQQILRLEIAMQDPSPMQILQGQKHLKRESLCQPIFYLDPLDAELACLPQDVMQVVRQQLQGKREKRRLAVIKDVFYPECMGIVPDDVGVFDGPEQDHFPQR